VWFQPGLLACRAVQVAHGFIRRIRAVRSVVLETRSV